MEADDFLAYQVEICRPVFPEHLLVGLVPDGGQVVQEGVKPYVYDVFRVEGHRNTPIEGRARDTQVFQALFDEVDHFVAPRRRLDKVRMLVDIPQHAVGVLAHLEEIAFFRHLFDGAAAVGAFAVHKLVFRPVAFTGDAVPAFVVLFVDIALVVNLLHDLLDHFDVAFLGRADKVIVGDIQPLPQGLEARDDLVDVLLRRHAFLGGLTLDFLAVFVAARQEEHIVSLRAVVTGQGIRHGRAVGMTDVQFRAGIINRCRNVEFCHGSHFLSFWSRRWNAPYYGNI